MPKKKLGVRETTVFDELIERLGGGRGIKGLAQSLHISRPTIMRWQERGHIPPDTRYDVVERVARLSGIPADILTGQVRYVGRKNGREHNNNVQ